MITDEMKMGIHKDDLLPEIEVIFHVEAESRETIYIERQKSAYIMYLLTGFAWSPFFRLALKWKMWRHNIWKKKSQTEDYKRKLRRKYIRLMKKGKVPYMDFSEN